MSLFVPTHVKNVRRDDVVSFVYAGQKNRIGKVDEVDDDSFIVFDLEASDGPSFRRFKFDKISALERVVFSQPVVAAQYNYVVNVTA